MCCMASSYGVLGGLLVQQLDGSRVRGRRADPQTGVGLAHGVQLLDARDIDAHRVRLLHEAHLRVVVRVARNQWRRWMGALLNGIVSIEQTAQSRISRERD